LVGNEKEEMPSKEVEQAYVDVSPLSHMND
jgi:hypothetical protein